MTMPPSGPWPPPPPQGPPPRWGPPPPPSRKGGRRTKWVLGGLGILVVVVITAVTTLLVTREGPDNRSYSPGVSASTGPTAAGGDRSRQQISVLTAEPTCAAWDPINNSLAAAEDNGWKQRDPSIPVSAWREDQLAQYRAVAAAMQAAADQTEPLANQTPNQIVETLYEQFIAYARAYAKAITLYEPIDDHLARVTVGLTLAISSICNAIAFGSADSRAPIQPSPTGTREEDSGAGINTSSRFLTQTNAVCPDIAALIADLSAQTVDWLTTDPNVPASKWDIQQRSINEKVIPVMNTFADRITQIGKRSNNPVIDSFSLLAAQYRRTFAAALPTYVPADNYLNEVATGVAGALNEACLAVGG